jgi:hypothetical protein
MPAVGADARDRVYPASGAFVGWISGRMQRVGASAGLRYGSGALLLDSESSRLNAWGAAGLGVWG